MFLLKILMLINLLAFSFIVAQVFMYMIALTNVQKNMDAPSYIRLRKLLDKNFRAKFGFVIYTSLLSSLLLCCVTATDPFSFLFITSLVAFFALITDILLALRGNMPINNRINTWKPDLYPADWEVYRDKWFFFFRWRQIAGSVGFVSLLLGALFGS